MQRLDKRLKFRDLLAEHSAARVASVRREKSDGIVTPIVGEAAIDEMLVGDEFVYRHQFDGRNTQRAEVVEHRGTDQAGVGAAQTLGHLRMARSESLDVEFVNQGSM